ncbi:MAG: nucleotidyltransferase family protein [Ruminococcaceae bacterium]|nr:nucleotidyltransferase family protein [Oscillospiraceae bacterium]
MNYGIVAEFNPFHNGHKYIVDTLKANGENTITAVMSESFVQRGECACMSPYERTKAALLNGVDLVLSLPVPYATASAERFALGGVTVLGSMGCIDALGFGSECGDVECLTKCAKAITAEEFSPLLENRLSEGLSFPTARQKALRDMYGDAFADALSSPNDLLGVEYIKAIDKNKFPIKPIAIKRVGVSHDSNEVSVNFCSASAIRSFLKNGNEIKEFMPEESFEILNEAVLSGNAPADFTKLENAILYKLRTMSIDDFKKIADVSEGLEYRFFEAVRNSVTLTEILEKVKTKRYTHSRLRRIVLCALLGITEEYTDIPVAYIRVLGFNEKGAEILKQAKNTATLPIVTKSSDIKYLDKNAKKIFELECKARDIFSLCLPVPQVCGKEMTDKLIVL